MLSSPSAAYFAIISDIHANIDALTAVLKDIENWPVRGIFCLGDVVGYGAEPKRCVEMIMETCALTVQGNHEALASLTEGEVAAGCRKAVSAPIALARRQLDDQQMSWMTQLPLAANIDPVMLSHAALNNPEYFHYIDEAHEAEAHFAAQETFVNFHGHTHVPAIWEDDGMGITCYIPSDMPVRLDERHRYAVNVGSVGQPRDSDPRASYTLYDFEERMLVHRRVEYDIARAQARIRKAGLPAHNAQRLKRGE